MTFPIRNNPGFLTQADLIERFSVRSGELATALAFLANSSRPLLLVGPRGMGKTTMALRLAAECERLSIGELRLLPVRFSEESYAVETPGEFWLHAATLLGEQQDVSYILEKAKSIRAERNDATLAQTAQDLLADYATAKKVRLLVVVENLRMILDEQFDAQSAKTLAQQLKQQKKVRLLATSESRIEGFEHSIGWANQFDTIELSPLSKEDCARLWHQIAGQTLSGRQARPLQILTGGNPRLLTILGQFASRASLRELMESLEHLIDEHTAYFKSQLDALPSRERKAYVALADLWTPATAREVAELSRLDVNTASALLHRLVSRGAVVEVKTIGKRTWYQVSERLYNIYHLLRHRTGNEQRVRAAVEFMTTYYEPDELVQVAASLGDEACHLAPHLRRDHIFAFRGLLRRRPALHADLLKAVTPEFLGFEDVRQSLGALLNADGTNAQAAPRGSYDVPDEEGVVRTDPISVKDAVNAVDSGWLDLTQAALALMTDKARVDEAVVAAEQASEQAPTRELSWQVLSLAYRFAHKTDEAIRATKRLVELNPLAPANWRTLIELYADAKMMSDAEESARSGASANPRSADLKLLLGDILAAQSKVSAAETVFRQVLVDFPEFSDARIRLGYLLEHSLHRPEQAEEMYREALKLKPTGHAWWHVGTLLERRNAPPEERENALREALRLEPDNGSYAKDLAHLYISLNRRVEAIDLERRFLERHPQDHTVWYDLGESSSAVDPLTAFEAFRMAIKTQPDCLDSWSALSSLFRKHLDLARNVVAQFQEEPDGAAWYLGLAGQAFAATGQATQAKNTLLAAYQAASTNSTLLGLYLDLALPELSDAEVSNLTTGGNGNTHPVGYLHIVRASEAILKHAREGLFETALLWLRQAAQKEPRNAKIQNTALNLLVGLGRWQEAAKEAADAQGRHLIEMSDFMSVLRRAILTGHSREAVEGLQQSETGSSIEPVIVAVQIASGQDNVTAPQEVREVANDILEMLTKPLADKNDVSENH